MKISVYITSYNQKDFLKQAIDSVLNQTLQPFEIIVVDDCSTDGSRDVIDNYLAKYPNLVKKHFNAHNLGITKTRNVALSLIKGDYFTWLDGDDIFLPQKLEKESETLKKSHADLVYSNFSYSKENIETIYQNWCTDSDQLPKTENIYKEVISRDFPRGSLFRYELVDVKLLKLVGNYDENLEIYEDFDFRARLCEVAKTTFFMEPLSVYRDHGEGLSKAKIEVHKKNLNYIVTKHQSKILKLDKQSRKKVQHSISNFMGRFENQNNQKSSAKSIIKRIVNKFKTLKK